MSNTNLRVLFSGYAPVHFLCFQPLFERLLEAPGVSVTVSGGTRTKTDDGWQYDAPALYRRLGVPAEDVMSVEEIRERDFDVLFSSHTKAILPRSVSRKVQIFHGISFRNRSVRSANLGYDHYFMAGPYQHRRFVETGLLGPSDPRALRIGFMKTDRLVDGTLDRQSILRRLGFSGDRPVLVYAPTGAKKNSLETIGEDVIGRLRAEDRYDIVVKPHDHPKNKIDWPARLAPLLDEHCRVTAELDVIPLLGVADLLLSDASSVSSEFSLRDRPIVFLDTPALIDRARSVEESALDLDTWGRRGGEVAASGTEAVAAVERSLEQPEAHSAVRRAMAQDLFYNPGRATAAAIDWLRTGVLTNAPGIA